MAVRGSTAKLTFFQAVINIRNSIKSTTDQDTKNPWYQKQFYVRFPDSEKNRAIAIPPPKSSSICGILRKNPASVYAN